MNAVFQTSKVNSFTTILADNSLTHGKTATQVILRYAEGPDTLNLFFEDDGIGIPNRIKDKIFLPDFPKQKRCRAFLCPGDLRNYWYNHQRNRRAGERGTV